MTTVTKYKLRSPSGVIVSIGPTDTFVRINQYGNVLTKSMIDILNASGRIPSYEQPVADGYLRTFVNGVTIEHPNQVTESSSAAFIVAIRIIGGRS
jgi:hypothetical protein